ncbi:MAG TPA: FHA domain-containing protein [Polyangiaceae bacterium]|nr:FHA domain-containing protein [Polyangiaceae bacterium]
MAQLRSPDGKRVVLLQSEHLIGRGEQCELRLNASYVSAQHAVIRWSGARWEVLDRGSRNGTRVNEESLQASRVYPLALGSKLRFGHRDECWVFENDDPPEPTLFLLGTGQAVSGNSGVIGIPSNASAEGTLMRAPDGSWKLEFLDGVTRPLANGEEFEYRGVKYRFCYPYCAVATASSAESAAEGILCFNVSANEEFVETWVEYVWGRVALGSRAHNYLLLTLARARQADQRNGVPESECGWLDKEELAAGLCMTPQQVDGDVFRARRHLGHLTLREAATVVERRPRTRQLRLGFSRTRIGVTAQEGPTAATPKPPISSDVTRREL